MRFEFREIYDCDDNRVVWLFRDSHGFKLLFDGDAEGWGEITLKEYSGGNERFLVHETQIKVIYVHLEVN